MVFLCKSAQMNSSPAASLNVGPSADPEEWGGPVRDTPTREGLVLRGAGVFSLGPAAVYTTGLPSLECTLLSEFCHPQMPLWTSSRPL